VKGGPCARRSRANTATVGAAWFTTWPLEDPEGPGLLAAERARARESGARQGAGQQTAFALAPVRDGGRRASTRERRTRAAALPARSRTETDGIRPVEDPDLVLRASRPGSAEMSNAQTDAQAISQNALEQRALSLASAAFIATRSAARPAVRELLETQGPSAPTIPRSVSVASSDERRRCQRRRSTSRSPSASRAIAASPHDALQRGDRRRDVVSLNRSRRMMRSNYRSWM